MNDSLTDSRADSRFLDRRALRRGRMISAMPPVGSSASRNRSRNAALFR
jgi:hypothetical protein